MLTYLAIYQGPVLSDSKIVAISSDPRIVDKALADINGNHSQPPNLRLVASNDTQGENND